LGAATPVPFKAATAGELVALLANEALAEAAPLACGVNVTVNVTALVVVTVTGNVRPLTENSEAFAPLMVTEVTVTLAPVAVSVPVAVPLVPMVTLPALMVVGETLNCPDAATPVPVNVATVGELEALLANEALAEAALVPVGVNVTVKATGLPVVTVTGKERPLTENSFALAPLMLTAVTVTLAPVAVSVPVAVPLFPTVTLPALMVVGETLNCPDAPTPVPVKLATAGELEALLTKDAVAEAEPLPLGVNVTVKVTGLPVATVTGNEIPLMENSFAFVPPMLTDVTVTLSPVAVSVPVAVPLFPTVTLPTFTPVVLNWPDCPVADPLNETTRLGSEAFEVIET
jgi:hypothetical protein